jgi:hypothetical protein
MSEIHWKGTAGHFIAARRCCFHLHTEVEGYRVSSVGCFHPASDPDGEPHEIGSGRLYETMVFRLGPLGVPLEWVEIDSDTYMDQASAEAGHMAMVAKFAGGA